MFPATDKRRLYWLLDLYNQKKISSATFVDEYNVCYNQELDLDQLDIKERKLFYELMIVACRFTDVQEDIIKYPNTYFSEADLQKKAVETQALLNLNSPYDGHG
jgi:hypothetical protein